MSLILHRAPRADLLVEGLADLLRTPLPDPFAQELVLVPAKGVERWLSQRLSHRLGHSESREDGVCAGVQFRSPASLVAEVTGTRERGPLGARSPWPGRCSQVLDARRRRTLGADSRAQHLGHGQEGEDAELRQGRRYSVARRLAGLFASYAVQRPTVLADWEAGTRQRRGRRRCARRPRLAAGAVAAAWSRAVGVPSPRRASPGHARRAARAPGGIDRCRACALVAVRTHPDRVDRGRAARRAGRSTATSTSGCPTRPRPCGARLSGVGRRTAGVVHARRRHRRPGRAPAAGLARPRPARAPADAGARCRTAIETVAG